MIVFLPICMNDVVISVIVVVDVLSWRESLYILSCYFGSVHAIIIKKGRL